MLYIFVDGDLLQSIGSIQLKTTKIALDLWFGVVQTPKL